jgi:hypothetical protein
MSLKLNWNVCDALQPLAKLFRPHEHEEFDFTRIEWANGVLIARGGVGRMHFQVHLNFYGTSSVLPNCSICGSGRYCPHIIATAALVHESGIADEIEYSDGTALVFTVERKSKREQRDSLWKSQLGMLAGHLRGFSAETPSRPTFPPNREAIYVLEPDRYSGFSQAPDIGVATRPLNARNSSRAAVHPGQKESPRRSTESSRRALRHWRPPPILSTGRSPKRFR